MKKVIVFAVLMFFLNSLIAQEKLHPIPRNSCHTGVFEFPKSYSFKGLEEYVSYGSGKIIFGEIIGRGFPSPYVLTIYLDGAAPKELGGHFEGCLLIDYGWNDEGAWEMRFDLGVNTKNGKKCVANITYYDCAIFSILIKCGETIYVFTKA